MAPKINSYIVQKLNDMRVNGVMCDLELVAEDGTCVLVHSAVWVAAFEDPSCLREMGKEYTLSSNQLDIFGVGGSVLTTVVEFIYGNKVELSDELKGALEKFGMKNWLTYLNLPVSKKYQNETKYGVDKYETKDNLKYPTNSNINTCGTQDGATSAISVTVKVEKDTDILEEQELRDRTFNSSAIDEPVQTFSECENKEIGFDLSRVKSEPLSPSAKQCSSGSLNFTFSSDIDSEQHEMERTSEQTSTRKTVLKKVESSNDTPSPENQISYASVSTLDTSGITSQELNKESPETYSQAGPVVLNVISLADSQNYKNITQWKKGKGVSSSRKTSKAPTSSPRRLQTLLPKQTEVLDSQSCEKPPSAETKDKSCYADETSTTKSNPSEENMVLTNKANFKIGSKLSKPLKTTNGRPLGPEPVKLFLNNSNLKSLQVGTPWNIVGNSNTANTSNHSSSTMFFPSGTSNMVTTTTTPVCSSIGTPIAVTSMNPGQNTVSNNSQVVRSSYNSITVPLGSFPNMQGLGANQNPNVIGNAGSGFVKPIAIGSPVVGPLQLTNSLTTGPIIGNFGCQVLQNTAQVSVSQTTPTGVNTASTASINNATLQNSGGIQLVNNQLGQLVFVNSNGTNNQRLRGPTGPQFRFVEPPQSRSVLSTNVLQNSKPVGVTPTRFSSVQNVIGSPLVNTGIISGTTVMLKGAAVVSTQTTCTTNPGHTVPSSTTTALSTSNKFQFSDRKLLSTGSNSEEKSISIGKPPEMQGTSSVTESEVAQDNAWKDIKHVKEKEFETSDVDPTDSDKSFVIDLENEDDDDMNPLEIPIAKNTIRNIRMKKCPDTLEKTTLQFQDINPVTKSAMYAPIAVTKKNLGTKKHNVSGRKKIVMRRRREPCLKVNEQVRYSPGEGAVDTSQHPDISQHPDTSQHPDISQHPVSVRRRGRPPKIRCGVLYSPAPVPQITSNTAGTPKTRRNKRKSEPTTDLSSDLLTKFRPIAPKSNVLATFQMTPLQ